MPGNIPTDLSGFCESHDPQFLCESRPIFRTATGFEQSRSGSLMSSHQGLGQRNLCSRRFFPVRWTCPGWPCARAWVRKGLPSLTALRRANRARSTTQPIALVLRPDIPE